MDKFIIQLGESKMMLSFIIIIGAIVGYLSYSVLDKPLIPESPDLLQRGNSLESFDSLNIDFSLLENETFRSLDIFGENPVNPGITGERKNPFAPI